MSEMNLLIIAVVAARFREKYGYPPREIILQRGLLWVGPVGEPETQPASPSVIGDESESL
jgi:hypothetical protein